MSRTGRIALYTEYERLELIQYSWWLRWGPLLGPGKAFDPTRYFIFCANVIGSPYGTVSSVTINPETGLKWGPEMPGSCVKDDVR
jgi:homoserine acetyltransferase